MIFGFSKGVTSESGQVGLYELCVLRVISVTEVHSFHKTVKEGRLL